jgi:CubicO group peptidase (beta-lactamase class C family)
VPTTTDPLAQIRPMFRTRGLIDQQLASGAYAGLQAYVSRGAVALLSLGAGVSGPGRAMTSETIHNLYCLTKPIIAAAVAIVFERRGLSFDVPLTQYSPRLAGVLDGSPITLRHVLGHTAGLHEPTAPALMLSPRAVRMRHLEAPAPAAGWQVGVDRAYSEVQGWNVLRTLIEDVEHSSLTDVTRQSVLLPLRIRDLCFAVEDCEWAAIEPRIGVHYDCAAGTFKPMVHQLLRKYCSDASLAVIGGHGTMEALGRFYEAVLRCVGGELVWGLPSPALMREMVTSDGHVGFDPIVQRELGFGLGFMTDLSSGWTACVGTAAFGHLGLLGTSVAFADPELGLVVAIMGNTFAMTEAASTRADRLALLRAIYADVME